MIDRVSTDSFTMEYCRFGQGERAMAILPGLSIGSVLRSAESIERSYAPLAEHFTVYLFDRRSDLPPVYSVYDMARDTAAAFDALGLKDVCLFGASQGGMMAMTMAVTRPDLVSRLILGSTAARVTGEMTQGLANWIRLAREKDGVGLFLSFGEKLYPPTMFTIFRNALINAGKAVTEDDLSRFLILAEGSRGFDMLQELPRIACPVLVMGDTADAVLGVAATREIADALADRPNVRSYISEDYGHAAYDTDPGYRKRMLQFFTD